VSRSGTRKNILLRGGLVFGGLALLALLLYGSGHWIIGTIFAVVAVLAGWLLLQASTVR
jgi:hypothetical protein